jgi:adenylate cyclase
MAGVIGGEKKHCYDVFGDAVILASKMESEGLPDFLHVSPTTFELVRDDFVCTARTPPISLEQVSL